MSGGAVWITGVGGVTAAGSGWRALLTALETGHSGVRPGPVGEVGGGAKEAVIGAGDETVPGGGRGEARPVAEENRARKAAGPAALCPDPPRSAETRRLDRSAALFLAAVQEAWADAGLPSAAPEPARCGVFEGGSLGPMAGLLDAASGGSGRPARPSALLRFMTGAGGAAFAQGHGIEGPVLHLSAGSVSAACAIGEAALAIRAGRLEMAVAGGSECPLHPAIEGSFRAAGILSETACRPFAAGRDGTILGEGAAALVLESEAHARARGGRPRALLLAYGLSAEGLSMVAPDPDGCGVAAAAGRALRLARAGPPGWIKTHGTATPLNDAAECRGLTRVLGPELPESPLVGLKSTLGHTLGASGAVETAAAVLALESELLPATLGTERPDPELPRCTLTAQPRELAARTALLLAASFGGRYAALVVGRA